MIERLLLILFIPFLLTLHPCIVYLSLSYANHSINGLTTSYDIKCFIYCVTQYYNILNISNRKYYASCISYKFQ